MPNREDHLQQVQQIERKLRQVLGRYTEVQERLQQAYAEIERLEEALHRKDEEIKNFQNQDNIAKIVDTIAVDAANATELKLKLNEYIREIDKCIAYLRD